MLPSIEELRAMTPEQLHTLFQANEAKIRKLESSGVGEDGISFRVSEKGGVSVYGLGRFPVTLYKSQWERLIANIPAVTRFMAENDAKLAVKPPKTTEA